MVTVICTDPRYRDVLMRKNPYVEVVAYDPTWVEAFEREQALIDAALGEVCRVVHHIGSTSVPGLAAKPVIDIMLEVEQLDALDARPDDLAALGYSAYGENGIPGRRYFVKGDDRRTHQIHAFATGDAHLARHLAFRDYLRAHANIAAEYAALKTALASSCEHDIDRYMDGKDAFIKRHEALALAWWPRRA